MNIRITVIAVLLGFAVASKLETGVQAKLSQDDDLESAEGSEHRKKKKCDDCCIKTVSEVGACPPWVTIPASNEIVNGDPFLL